MLKKKQKDFIADIEILFSQFDFKFKKQEKKIERLKKEITRLKMYHRC